MEKQIVKSHKDPITVPCTTSAMMQEYEKNGYKVKRISPSSFKLMLDDGEVTIYWSEGAYYQEIIEDKNLIPSL